MKQKQTSKIWVITWRYTDGSGSGCIRVFENKDTAQRDMDLLEMQDSPRCYELAEVEYIDY